MLKVEHIVYLCHVPISCSTVFLSTYQNYNIILYYDANYNMYNVYKIVQECLALLKVITMVMSC